MVIPSRWEMHLVMVQLPQSTESDKGCSDAENYRKSWFQRHSYWCTCARDLVDVMRWGELYTLDSGQNDWPMVWICICPDILFKGSRAYCQRSRCKELQNWEASLGVENTEHLNPISAYVCVCCDPSQGRDLIPKENFASILPQWLKTKNGHRAPKN